jgi:hypothetical protein
MAQRHEFCHQRLKVVDLSVVDDTDCLVLVEQRLVAGREVHYREPTVAEPNPRVDVITVSVWSTMTEDIGHSAKQRPIDLGLPAIVEDTCDTAHLL